MFHLSFFSSVVEAAEDEFFIVGKNETPTKKRLVKLDLSLIRKGYQS
jgi:hypothetical protein